MRIPATAAMIVNACSLPMLGFDPPHDQQPVTWWRGYPIHAATLLVIVHCITALCTTLAIAAGYQGLVEALVYYSPHFYRGAIWQFFTYGFVHTVDLWFAVEMYLLWSFGRELEKFLGRDGFLRLYLALYLVTPAFLTLLGLGTITYYAGSGALHFAIFIAFATLYPDASMLFGITAKWAAVILLAINGLQALQNHAWTMLLVQGVNAGLAFAFIRWSRGLLVLPSFSLFKRKPRFRVLPSPEKPTPSRPQRKATPPSSSSEVEDIDPLLDKIAKSGMSSLTAAERARLERARAALLKKDPGAH